MDCVVFTSASTVKGFVEGTKGLDYTKVKAACIGKQTKAAADAYGMQTRMRRKEHHRKSHRACGRDETGKLITILQKMEQL
mgnify:CR=1 FL=1